MYNRYLRNDEGVYYTVKKARGRKNCLKAAMDQLVKDAAQWPSYCLAVVHGGAAEEAAEVLAQLKARLPHVRHIYTGTSETPPAEWQPGDIYLKHSV